MTTVEKLLHHFGLTALPFDRAVPPDGLLRHPSFTEAAERLRFAIDTRAPALLVAAPGIGKSVLLESVCGALAATDVRVVYTPLTACGPFGLVGQLAARYGTPLRRTTAQTAAALLDELARSPKTEVLVLDEAHRLPDASLEELRLLGQLDFDRRAPFVLLLAGQPSLRDRLQTPDFEALWQRLAVRAALSPLTDRETAEYLDRRPRAVGARAALFRPGAVDRLFEHGRGIMRRLNQLATGALLAAARAGRKHVDHADVQAAIFDDEHA
ncbi:MAG TPA: AAA family ATPase [Methylomirabilota bacterium]|jgi:type II secretory pathway predicted ATPase ExeA|nr:AAA family ATPase [Methylomirabilota bacterium]